jgi:hypothetical protein
MAFAFNNRKKSWKSRGSGIIFVRSLAEQFEAFKALLHGLPPPEFQVATTLVQTSDGNFPAIHSRALPTSGDSMRK